MGTEVGKRIDILLEGYKTAKSEQQARIGFRDNLLYVTLAANGAVTAFALSKDGPNLALLAIPLLVLILGWAYIINDEKISAIGRYIRNSLEPELQKMAGSNESLFGWEIAHRSDDYRLERKVIQMGIDLLTFAGFGMGAIVFFLVREPKVSTAALWMCGIEGVMMLFLIFEIVTYADLKKGK